MRTALLGGSFNPPHVGHLILAETVRRELNYDMVLFVPAFFPPHKNLASGASVEDRIAMLKKAVEGNSHFKIELCEIQRGGVSYTIDTVEYLEKKMKKNTNSLESKIGVILGDDLAEGFCRWKNAVDLAQKTNLILAHRSGTELQKSSFDYPHVELLNAYIPVSSSDIRNRISQKKSFRYLVPEGVYQYITDRNLYEY